MKKGISEKKLEKLLVDFTESLTGEAGGATKLSSEDFDCLLEETEARSSLFETVWAIESAIQPEQPAEESSTQTKQPSEEFSNNLLQAVQERFQEQNSARKIQSIIGMAITDDGFRKSFFQDVVATCRNFGFDLTPQEVAALIDLKEDDVEKFANSLDERITKFFPTSLS